MKTSKEYVAESDLQVHLGISKKLDVTAKKEFNRILNYYNASVVDETDKSAVVLFKTALEKKAFIELLNHAHWEGKTDENL